MKTRAFFAVLLFSTRALAEEPLPAPVVLTYPPGDDSITAVKKGEPAPYAGQLFDNETALRWAFFLQQYKLRYGTDLKAEKDSCRVLVGRETEYRKIEEKRNSASEADLRERLMAAEKARKEAEDRLHNQPLWKEPILWYAFGIVTTTVVVVLAQEQK